MTTATRYDLFADYFQFYLQDDDPSYDDLSAAWTEDAMERMLAASLPYVSDLKR